MNEMIASTTWKAEFQGLSPADGKTPVTTGTVRLCLRCVGGADDGKYWCHTHSAWEASDPDDATHYHRTLTHRQHGLWRDATGVTIPSDAVAVEVAIWEAASTMIPLSMVADVLTGVLVPIYSYEGVAGGVTGGSGSHLSTWAKDGVPWSIVCSGVPTSTMLLRFRIPGRMGGTLHLSARYDNSGNNSAVKLYGTDYANSGAQAELTNPSTYVDRDGVNYHDYTIPLESRFVDPATGTVEIFIQSSNIGAAAVIYCDYAAITYLGSPTEALAAIAQKVQGLSYSAANELLVVPQRLVDGIVKKTTFDNATAYALEAPDNSASVYSLLGTVAGYVDTEVAAIKTVTDKLGTTFEGAGPYAFTAAALANTPTGGGELSTWDSLFMEGPLLSFRLWQASDVVSVVPVSGTWTYPQVTFSTLDSTGVTKTIATWDLGNGLVLNPDVNLTFGLGVLLHVHVQVPQNTAFAGGVLAFTHTHEPSENRTVNLEIPEILAQDLAFAVVEGYVTPEGTLRQHSGSAFAFDWGAYPGQGAGQVLPVGTDGRVLISADPLPELAQGQPPATPSLHEALMLLYMALRNGRLTTSSLLSILDDAGVVVAKASLSDDGSVFTQAKLVSGP